MDNIPPGEGLPQKRSANKIAAYVFQESRMPKLQKLNCTGCQEYSKGNLQGTCFSEEKKDQQGPEDYIQNTTK